ncbi:hypothetical protein [Mycobacterium sp. 050134]|uniref:hypothetical protein n=1 Tax=Mycobacterium sp. 050134 TaxID=3096111 RepID=UPI002EDA869C
MRSVLVWLMVLFGAVSIASGASIAPSKATPCQPAELFVTDNSDPLFESQADETLDRNGIEVTGSTPLDGAYWSTALQRLTFERSREFHLCDADGSALHAAAEALRRRFDQASVLTFDYLPPQAPQENAILITVPDIDIGRLGGALAADPTARSRLRGGSVTATDHTLILVAGEGDREVARRLVGEAGGDWDTAAIAGGRGEFVE